MSNRNQHPFTVVSTADCQTSARRTGHLSLAYSNADLAAESTNRRANAPANSKATGSASAPICDYDRYAQWHSPDPIPSRGAISGSGPTPAPALNPAQALTPTAIPTLVSASASSQSVSASSPAERLRASALTAMAENTARHAFEGSNVLAFHGRSFAVNDAALANAISPLARNMCFWLEEAFENHPHSDDSSRMIPIWVEHLPEQVVVDQALLMLQLRGWLVIAPAPTASGAKRSGTVQMKLRWF
jgi:hypothetical protein